MVRMTTVGSQNDTNSKNGSTDGGRGVVGDGSGGGSGGGNIYDYPVHKNAALVITWVELVFMLILNGVVIAGLLCRRRRNRLSFFVLHLAFTDFGLGLLYLLPDAITRTTEQWYAGETVCIMYQYISHVMPYVSSFMLVVAVVIFVCGVMFVPAIIICVCYSLIVYTIWIRLKRGMHIAPKRTRNSADLDQMHNKGRTGLMSRAKVKSIIMTFVVVIVYSFYNNIINKSMNLKSQR
ncbi:hypothetical protein KUTeg_020847, partial [Tegillarca granosa]